MQNEESFTDVCDEFGNRLGYMGYLMDNANPYMEYEDWVKQQAKGK